MSETRSFTLHTDRASRVVGVLVMSSALGLLALAEFEGIRSLGTAVVPCVVFAIMGPLLILNVAEVTVDPVAATLTRRRGIWPFVRTEQRAFAEATWIVRDVVTHRRGRARVPREHNQLRVGFRDGKVWELIEEFHTGTRARELGERLSALTGVPFAAGEWAGAVRRPTTAQKEAIRWKQARRRSDRP